jgi:hypothetical protein
VTADQETLDEALFTGPRVFVHVGCQGWVRFRLSGPWCLRCQAGPLRVDEYAKPSARAERAA